MTTVLRSIARPLEFLLGLVFVAAALMKVMDANAFLGQMYRYEIMESRQILAFGSLLTIFVETAIGVALILGYRRHFLAIWGFQAMLVVFSALVFVYWPKECGCFGKYLSMGPVETIGKNIVMIIMGAVAMYGFTLKESGVEKAGQFFRLALSCLVGAVFVGCTYPQVFKGDSRSTATTTPAKENVDKGAVALAGQSETVAPVATTTAPGPFSGYEAEDAFGETHDLGKGTYLVACLSMTCDHCMASIPDLNNLALNPEHPPMVALGYEPREGTLEEFVGETSPVFPIRGIGNSFLEFSELIDKEPPRLALIRDGHVLHAWDGHMPSEEKLQKVLEKYGATNHANN